MDKISLIFLLTAMLALAHVGKSETCYECVYDTVAGGDERCEDPFDENSGVPNVTGCQYGCIKTSLDNGVSVLWARSCNPDPLSQCVNTCASQGGVTACAHCCSEDFCNGAGTVGISSLVIAFGSFLALFIRFSG